MCDMTHSYAWHGSFVCVAWRIHMCGMTHSYVWRDSFTSVPWLIHVCDTTPPYVWHNSFTCVTQLIHMCDTIRSHYVTGSFLCVTWRKCNLLLEYTYYKWNEHAFLYYSDFLGRWIWIVPSLLTLNLVRAFTANSSIYILQMKWTCFFVLLGFFVWKCAHGCEMA